MTLALVPQPAAAEPRPGRHVLDADTRIGASGPAEPQAQLLREYLRSGTGIAVPVTGVDGPGVTVRLRIGPEAGTHPESYLLDVTAEGADLVGATPAGLARAVQTLRQLLPPDALRRSPVLAEPAWLPCCHIQDSPRYDWRGLHLDVARHWMPKDFLLRLIDLAALHRYNVLHLHLTDDQGWRLEVPSRPRLTEVGSWRPETVLGHARAPLGYDGTPHGGYYTRVDLREVVAYAAERQVMVLPEIDLPGHVQAVLAAYPELGCGGAELEVMTTWGVSEHVLAPTGEALAFAREVLDTVFDVFPAPYVHLGGDECPRTEWRASAFARERAAELGLGSVDELQSWFLGHLAAYAAERGRRPVGWDEVLEDGGMPRDTVVMAWQAGERGADVLRAGHDLIMCPQERVYLDHYQSDDPAEPLGLGGLSTLDDVIAVDPVPPGAPEGSGPGRLLGVQAQLWTEYLPTPRHVEYMAFPRLAAVAEVGWTRWTQPQSREAAGFRTRLEGHLRRLDALGVGYRPLDGPQPWQRGGTGARQRREH